MAHSVWRAHRIWWWMILAPIFLGEPRLCTQKMVAKGIDWGGVLGGIAAVLAPIFLVSSLLIILISVLGGIHRDQSLTAGGETLGAFWNQV